MSPWGKSGAFYKFPFYIWGKGAQGNEIIYPASQKFKNELKLLYTSINDMTFIMHLNLN